MQRQPVLASRGALLLLCGLIGWPASQAQPVALARHTVQDRPAPQTAVTRPLKDVLNTLSRTHGINILFEEATVENIRVSEEVLKTSGRLDRKLTELLRPYGLVLKPQGKSAYLIVAEPGRLKPTRPSAAATLPLETSLGPVSELLAQASPLRLPASAPEKVISVQGQVKAASGTGLPGVNVTLKGTVRGTTTDAEGRYQLSVPDAGAVLVFSFIGYEKMEVPVGNRTTIDVTLTESSSTLDEVVVTAFGIKREQKALGYASQKVEGTKLTAVPNTNLLNALQGKAAGVTVRLSSGMPGRAPQVSIRGARSLTGSNQPLYVVDGLPVSGGERAIDFNPADIESIDILKGPAASALYGLRASNGVIVITTKSGKASQSKPSITFDTQVSQDRVSFLPDLQMEYAQGDNGVFNQTGLFSWGSRIDKIGTYTNALGQPEQAAAYDNDKAFYQTGNTLTSSLEVAQGGSFGNYAVGIAQTSQSGIVPNSGLNRTNFKINGQFTPYERFKLGLSLNYSNLKVDDYPDEGGNLSFFRGITETPPSYNLKGKPYADPANPFQQIFFRAAQNNPYWIINNNYRDTKTNRTFGNVFAEYRIAQGLKAVYRVGIDYFGTRRVNYQELGTGPVGRTNPPSGGFLQLVNTQQSQLNSNLFLTYDKSFGENLTANVIVGNEVYDIRTTQDRSEGSNFVAGRWANLANATNIAAFTSLTRQRVVGFYGNINLGYKDMVFLSASGRNDLVSNMPAANRSFFYPSLGLSAVVTEIVPALQRSLTFAKIRANFAEVGQAGPLFVNGVGYSQRNPSGLWTGAFQFPFNGITSFNPSLTTINPGIRPENTRSFEAGFELRFLRNRVSIDYTFFRSLSDGQILAVPLPISTGATSEIRNAGKLSSKGHEVTLTVTPVKTAKLQWDLTTNFTNYRTMVESLPQGLSRIILADHNAGQVMTVAEVGHPYPSLFGRTYARDPQSGQIVVNGVPGQATTGIPLLNNIPRVVATPNPDFELNFLNTLRLGRASLSFQLDWRKGGFFYSHSQAESRWRGVAAETLNREEEVVIPGKKGRFVNGQLVVEGDNDLKIFRQVTYYNTLFNNLEAQLNDASFVRLREVNLSFDLPTTWLRKTLGIGSASVYLTGRNLFLLTKAFVDPELNMTNLSGSSVENSAGIEVGQQPQTRSFGAGLRIKWEPKP